MSFLNRLFYYFIDWEGTHLLIGKCSSFFTVTDFSVWSPLSWGWEQSCERQINTAHLVYFFSNNPKSWVLPAERIGCPHCRSYCLRVVAQAECSSPIAWAGGKGNSVFLAGDTVGWKQKAGSRLQGFGQVSLLAVLSQTESHQQGHA